MTTGRLSTRPSTSELADEQKLRREKRAARQRERWTSPRRAEASSPSPFGGAVIYAMGWPEGETTVLGESLFCPFWFFVSVSK
jgi:hypothetical protein